MTPDRRDLLTTGLAALAAGGLAACGARESEQRSFALGDFDSGDGWDRYRGLFALSPDSIDMSAMLIASHPSPVRTAIERHRDALDAEPTLYLEGNNSRLTGASRAAVRRYFGVGADQVALTGSATMGDAIVGPRGC